MKFALVSLGCPKNQVDGDIIARRLLDAGHESVGELESADVCLINTCGFITSAKEEAIENIFNAVAAREENPDLKIIVTGCLAERYKDEISRDIPEVDAIVGIGSNSDIVSIAQRVYAGEKVASYGEKTDLDITAQRVLSTPSHYAYLKIAEGCSNGCYYCAIPMIRGPHRSRPVESCLEEAIWLVDNGVKELIIVAQDITRYGFDLYGQSKLADLVNAISKIDGIQWIRLMYAYPERLSDDMIEVIATNPKVLHYIDLPIQHIDPRVLKSMNRKGGTEVIYSAINRLRRAVPDICIRTSLITGYPGETEEEFLRLKEFVNDTKFGRLGCFAFSPEEGTVAAKMEGQIPDEEKERRADSIMRLQTEIMAQSQASFVGKEIEVICDEYDEENDRFVCRSHFDAPDIDGRVYLPCDSEINIGDILTVRVVDSDLYDLYREII